MQEADRGHIIRYANSELANGKGSKKLEGISIWERFENTE